MPFAAAIIPVYNHSRNIGNVLNGCLRHFKEDDILVVDDGSTDFSASQATRRGVHLRRHTTNQGKGKALKTGFEWALSHGAEWVLTLDADGQHLPTEIPKFLRAAEKGQNDLIIGARDIRLGKMPAPRWFSNWTTSRMLSHVVKKPILDSQCGYRIIRADLIAAMDLKADDYLLETEMILTASRLEKSIGFVPIETVYNDEVSHFRKIKSMVRFAKTLWANRNLWKELASQPGN